MDCWIVFQLLALLNSILLSAAYRHRHVHTSVESCEHHGAHTQPIDSYSSGASYPDSGHGAHAQSRIDSYSIGASYPDSGHGPRAQSRIDTHSSGASYPDSGHGAHAQSRIDSYSIGATYPDSGHGPRAQSRIDTHSSGASYPDSGHGAHAQSRIDSYSIGTSYPDSGHGPRAQSRIDTHSSGESYPHGPSEEAVIVGRSITDGRIMNRRGVDGGANSTKIVSIADRLQVGDPDKIVFPTSDSFVPNVPAECKKEGICEEVPEYPDIHVNQLVEQLGNAREQFKIDELLVPVSIASRNGGPGEEKPCRAFERVVIPRAAPDKDGTWKYIVNQKEALQGVRVEICDSRNTEEDLARFVYPLTGYKLGCKQEYMIRHLYTLNDRGQMVLTAMKLPSCCAFVASADENLGR